MIFDVARFRIALPWLWVLLEIVWVVLGGTLMLVWGLCRWYVACLIYRLAIVLVISFDVGYVELLLFCLTAG